MNDDVCLYCGWPIHSEWAQDRRAATTLDNEDGWHWRHAVEPTRDHDATPGGEPNARMKAIVERVK
jgi:hypothetical protein